MSACQWPKPPTGLTSWVPPVVGLPPDPTTFPLRAPASPTFGGRASRPLWRALTENPWGRALVGATTPRPAQAGPAVGAIGTDNGGNGNGSPRSPVRFQPRTPLPLAPWRPVPLHAEALQGMPAPPGASRRFQYRLSCRKRPPAPRGSPHPVLHGTFPNPDPFRFQNNNTRTRSRTRTPFPGKPLDRAPQMTSAPDTPCQPSQKGDIFQEQSSEWGRHPPSTCGREDRPLFPRRSATVRMRREGWS